MRFFSQILTALQIISDKIWPLLYQKSFEKMIFFRFKSKKSTLYSLGFTSETIHTNLLQNVFYKIFKSLINANNRTNLYHEKRKNSEKEQLQQNDGTAQIACLPLLSILNYCITNQ